MALGIICIVKNEKRDDANLVFAARGMGPSTFSRALCAIDPNATFETAPTHWLTSDATSTATEAELAILQAMTRGDLPPVPPGTVWGVDGVITAADAMAATDGANMHVYSCAGKVEPLDHAAAVLASEGLQFVPDPPM